MAGFDRQDAPERRRPVGALGAGEELSALDLGEAAPDAVWLTDGQRVLAALGLDGTDLADGLGANFAPFPLVFAFLGTGWEEEV